jgi:phage terminase large subunit-like protein
MARLIAEPADGRREAVPWQPRANQLPPPGSWHIWLFIAGRGAGKTRAGAEFVLQRVRDGARRIALVGATTADVRDVMVEGDSGILSVAPSDIKPRYIPSLRRLVWPNGAIATTYSAEEPDRLRGPQHDTAWPDEVATWQDAHKGVANDTAWSNLMLGLRLGDDPRCCATSTPKPVKLVRELWGDAEAARNGVVMTRGTTYENLDNLAPAFRTQIITRYEGTRLGRQELQGELLEDVEGALWKLAMFDDRRTTADLARVVVGVDPSGSSTTTSNEAGIIVAGKGADGDGYVLADRSGVFSPDQWARRAVAAYYEYAADRIVAERNFGGDMVLSTIRTVDPQIKVELVTASRGKMVRAEPVAALYEQGRIHHAGVFDELEAQMTTWTQESGESPDRMDALVWALTDLFITPTDTSFAFFS